MLLHYEQCYDNPLRKSVLYVKTRYQGLICKARFLSGSSANRMKTKINLPLTMSFFFCSYPFNVFWLTGNSNEVHSDARSASHSMEKGFAHTKTQEG